jgi:hypothetical protein
MQCPVCGRLSRGVCAACVREEAVQLGRLRALLAERGPLSAEEISRETGVPVERVLRWLREGRLQPVPGALRCRGCGRPVHAGDLCGLCRADMVREVREAVRGLRACGSEVKPDRPRRTLREGSPRGRFDI